MFKGVYTAIITPFNTDETIDENSLKKLIEFNIENGVSGIVVCGTTGESPTLSEEEKLHLIDLVVKQVNKRVPVIAGTGCNCTKKTIELSKKAQQLGADALLIVNPYYNKPTQEGLFRHFKAVSDSVNVPCIVYNIPGRTGVNVETTTLLRLINACTNITAVKEASGDMSQIREVISKTPENFSVLSGDDGLTLDLIKAGGFGVVSVASNLVPKEMSDLVTFALEKKSSEAVALNDKLKGLFKAEFIETNPVPIKYMLAKKGLCEEVYRLPLCELSEGSRVVVDEVFDRL